MFKKAKKHEKKQEVEENKVITNPVFGKERVTKFYAKFNKIINAKRMIQNYSSRKEVYLKFAYRAGERLKKTQIVPKNDTRRVRKEKKRGQEKRSSSSLWTKSAMKRAGKITKETKRQKCLPLPFTKRVTERERKRKQKRKKTETKNHKSINQPGETTVN